MLTDECLVKFPRTFHMPFSPGATSDDKILKSLDHFIGLEVVVTEKVDGENTTFTRTRTHARSVDSANHWSRAPMKKLHSELCWKLQQPQFSEIHRICGENAYATHSISYTGLPSYFMCFSVWDHENNCMSWDDTQLICEELGLSTVPVLARGVYIGDGKISTACETETVRITDLVKVSLLGGESCEGVVIRVADSFHYNEYATKVAKWVRAGHVQTDEHWMHRKERQINLEA